MTTTATTSTDEERIMTDLTPARRHKMSPGEFALPGERFPLNDRTHEKLAIPGATRAERAGNITPGQEAMIKRKARAKLGEGSDHDQDDVPMGRLDA
jgi:hypothetical protein